MLIAVTKQVVCSMTMLRKCVTNIAQELSPKTGGNSVDGNNPGEASLAALLDA